MRLAICDDSAADAAYILSLVQKWAANTSNPAETELFPSAEAFLFRYEENKAFDILLLDIEMGGMSGVELAKLVRSGNKEVQLIFITGYMDYIQQGYDVEALHYLLKPVTEAKLFPVLDRAVLKRSASARALVLQTGALSVRVPLHEISYIEVDKNYVTVHAASDHTVKMPLSAIETELDESFFKTGRSFIVNLRFFSRATRTDVYLKTGARVPLSRGLYDKLNRALIEQF